MIEKKHIRKFFKYFITNILISIKISGIILLMLGTVALLLGLFMVPIYLVERTENYFHYLWYFPILVFIIGVVFSIVMVIDEG